MLHYLEALQVTGLAVLRNEARELLSRVAGHLDQLAHDNSLVFTGALQLIKATQLTLCRQRQHSSLPLITEKAIARVPERNSRS